MRAAEMAAGAVFDLLKVLWDVTHAELLMHPALVALENEGRFEILAEFVKARKYVFFYFKLKLSFWEQLPWQMFGLADHRIEYARACTRRVLKLFDAAPSMHWLAICLCEHGSIGRSQLERFISGTSLDALPALEFQVAKMRFVLIVERWIEGRHALAQNQFPSFCKSDVANICSEL